MSNSSTAASRVPGRLDRPPTSRDGEREGLPVPVRAPGLLVRAPGLPVRELGLPVRALGLPVREPGLDEDATCCPGEGGVY